MSLAAALARVQQLDAIAAPPAAPPAPAQGAESFAAALAGASGASGPYEPLVRSAASRYGVDPSVVRAVMQQESGGDATATSAAGAQGLMQLMPGTARGLGVTNPFDPAQSLDAGTRYLRGLLDEFGGDTRLALAAYNAGPNAVRQYGGVPPYPETQRYVEHVLALAGGGS